MAGGAAPALHGARGLFGGAGAEAVQEDGHHEIGGIGLGVAPASNAEVKNLSRLAGDGTLVPFLPEAVHAWRRSSPSAPLMMPRGADRALQRLRRPPSWATTNGVTSPTTTSPQIFISYVDADRSSAVALHDALSAAGLRAWVDVVDLQPGDSWSDAIEEAVDQARLVVILTAT